MPIVQCGPKSLGKVLSRHICSAPSAPSLGPVTAKWLLHTLQESREVVRLSTLRSPILAAERNGEEPTCVRYGARLFRTLSSNPPKAPGGNHLIPSLHVWKLLSRMTNRWEQGYSQKWSHRDRNTDWFVCFHSLRFFNFIFPHHHPHPPASPRKCRAIQNKALKTQDCVQPVLAPWTSCK